MNYREELIKIAQRWPGNREVRFDVVTDENIIKLIHDSIGIACHIAGEFAPKGEK